MSLHEILDTEHIRYSHLVSEEYAMESMHIHNVYEIYVAQSNGVKFLVNNRIYKLSCGDVMLFTETDLHKVSVPANSRYDRYVITFSPHLLPAENRDALLACFADMQGRQTHKVQLTPGEQQTLLSLLQALAEEQRQPVLQTLGMQLALSRILVFLNRVRQTQPKQLPTPSHAWDPHIRVVLEYIDSHYSHPFTLDDLAGLCYLNKYYLCRLFRRQTGFCIQDYITYRRLSAAVVLLWEGKSISATAQLSGFNSDTFFITTFKKHFGMTPYRYVHRDA